MTRVLIAYDDARVRAWTRQNPGAARRGMRRFLLKAGQLGVREMRRVMKQRFGRVGVRHPGLGPPTGATGASVRASRGASFVDVGPNTSYAGLVNDGTKPHVIRARRGRFLRFALPGQGAVFARKVRHPGSRGHHFVERTARIVRPQLPKLAEQTILQEVR